MTPVWHLFPFLKIAGCTLANNCTSCHLSAAYQLFTRRPPIQCASAYVERLLFWIAWISTAALSRDLTKQPRTRRWETKRSVRSREEKAVSRIGRVSGRQVCTSSVTAASLPSCPTGARLLKTFVSPCLCSIFFFFFKFFFFWLLHISLSVLPGHKLPLRRVRWLAFLIGWPLYISVVALLL